MTSSNSTNQSKHILARVLVVAVVVVLLFVSSANAWTDYLWYQSMHQLEVFWTAIVSKGIIGIVAFIATALLCLLSMLYAFRKSPGWSKHTEGQSRAKVVETPQGPRTISDPRSVFDKVGESIAPVLRTVIIVAALGYALIQAIELADQWETLRLALSRVNFGTTDPQFGIDVGFYVFQLPALEIIQTWLTSTVFFIIVLTGLVYLFAGAIRPWASTHKVLSVARAHVSVLLALFMVLMATDNALKILKLNYSSRGQVVGASYTDVHATLPALVVMVVVCLLLAVVLLVNIKLKGWKLPIIGLAVWGGMSVIAVGVIPAVVQKLVVDPNEASLEAPYIKRNIKMTRQAYGLTDVKGKQFAADTSLTPEAVVEDKDTIDNIRLWDTDVAQKTYEQLQAIRPYYNFKDVDVDRYKINGKLKQVLVSPREMNIDDLASTAQTWVNRHLVYTHGYGNVMSSASEYDTRGLPKFEVGDIPPKVAASAAKDSPALDIKQPRIYFGEEESDYAIVNTGIKEFDYPQGEKNATTTYQANTGVKVGSFLRRAAWSLRFESLQMLFSGYVKEDSQVLLYRNVAERIGKFAPWLDLDEDLYTAVVDGRIVWVAEGYTTSTRYPYAERYSDNGINYIRNSVKVTIDAYTGETTFYAFDTTDPVLKAWARIYPNLLTSADKMPAALKEHLRYPLELFKAQAEIYRTYHMTDPTVFYNKEDQWEIPTVNGKEMEPFFVLLKLPGSDKEQLYMMQPYTPRNRDNMIGWMAVSSDAEEYGKRTVYLFPKERVILGPGQISARINQDPDISPQFSLWDQRGSQVIFGKMVVVPIKDSIVYVQPVFLQAEQTAIPELASVVVAYGDNLVMNRDFKTALAEALKTPGTTTTESTTGSTSGSSSSSSASGSSESTGTSSATQSLAEQGTKLYKEALEAQKKGDWALYGEKIDALGKVLEEMNK